MAPENCIVCRSNNRRFGPANQPLDSLHPLRGSHGLHLLRNLGTLRAYCDREEIRYRDVKLEDSMKGYLIMLGAAILVISIVGGSLYLSGSYNTYETRLRELGAQPGSSVTLFDQTKWQFAQVLGCAIIFGGLIFGSMLMGLGWIGKTLEQVRDLLAGEVAQGPPRKVLETKNSMN